MTPIQASNKSNEKIVFNNLQMIEKSKNQNSNWEIWAEIPILKFFSKGDSTNYSYKL